MAQLTEEQREIFEALHQDRVEDYKVFSKRNYGGLFKGVIEKYPESAHFVFELLQNADDANATEVSILLKQDRLLFKHNGSKHFDVAPPNSDINADINSITGIGDSTKIDTQNKIGKFGVGFKSVFQYTRTPEVYDDTFKFKIENYIIPTLIDHDYEGRNEGETLFVFPFSSPSKNYEEINNKIKHLPNPLLFLNNVKKIVWRVEDSYGVVGPTKFFEKKKLSSEKTGSVLMELYDLISPHGETSIFLFSQTVKILDEDNREHVHPIHVGFYYDKEKKELITKHTNQKVYCFFPTKESLKTCFILHAPFLLTENRQNIKPGEYYNTKLIEWLASLSTKSVVLLRDYGVKHDMTLINENIVNILPKYDLSDTLFNDSTDREYKKIFETAFQELVYREPLFISRDGAYLLSKYAYKTVGSIYELVDKNQFKALVGKSGTDFLKWDLLQTISKRDGECKYYDAIKEYTIEDFANSITPDFMQSQPKSWILKFYTFVREEGRKYWVISNQTKGSSLAFRKAPIILTQQGDWLAPFTGHDLRTTNVFLPVDKGSSEDYNFINWDYLKEEAAKKLFDAFEIKSPDKYSYIRNVVLEKYKDNALELDYDELHEDFKTIFNYYKEIKDTEKERQFINDLRKYYYLVGSDGAQHPIDELYADEAILKKYFGKRTLEVFVNSDFYYEDVDTFQKPLVKVFIDKLVTQKIPLLEDISFKQYDAHLKSEYKRYLPPNKKYNEFVVTDYRLAGFDNAIQKNIIESNKDISVFLWNNVVPAYMNEVSAKIQASNDRRQYYDPYSITSTFESELTEYPWLYNKRGQLVWPSDTYVEDLDSKYDLENGVVEFLGISKKMQDLREKYNATDEEQKRYEIGSKFEEEIDEDFSEEEALMVVREAKAKKKREKAKQEALEKEKQTERTEESNSLSDYVFKQNTTESIEDKLEKRWEEKKNRHVNKPSSSTFQGEEMLFDNGKQGIETQDNNAPLFDTQYTAPNTSDREVDDTARAEKNLKAKDKSAQAQAENAKDMVDTLGLLKQTPEYTFKWFKIIMELMHAGQDKITERRVQIDFAKYEMTCSDKILHLIEPSRPVPAWVCDAEKFSITALSNGKTAKIDGLIVKSADDCIDVSVEVNDKMLNDLRQTKKIRIDAVDNTNIINSLETRFLQLEKEDDFDMNANLPHNLSFIYGPPGTGKTTKLVERVHNLLEKEPNAKILVLTPTNKAADVVALKMSNDDVCEGVLARYGATESLYLIEEIGCVTNRDTTDMNGWHNIVVATAARYAYDFVQPDDTPICDYPWDYIFIDEASMIDILTITYILYKGANAKEIIISGDPKQIQPVVPNDIPAYNIYNMVGLKGFADAIFDYKRYSVEGLMMQHRSIPVIGEMVSDFAYDGLVKCDPNRVPMKPLKLDGISIKNVNFIAFDIAELDEIKGLTSIGQSAFNLYSVIFTYNMIEYTIKQIEKNYPKQEYSIGVVCAYRAQSDAIKNLLENRPLDTTYCKVTCGTVHSFQGDECDIMFIVLNPPAECTSGTHVNNENIINVAMSRARDYLFFILPNGQQKGFFMKNRIGKVVSNSDRTMLECKKIEQVLFHGNDNFIYENTHVTCHMPVNVYCEDNAVYEVKMSDDAIDIKINM